MEWFALGILIFIGLVGAAAKLMFSIKPPKKKNDKDDNNK